MQEVAAPLMNMNKHILRARQTGEPGNKGGFGTHKKTADDLSPLINADAWAPESDVYNRHPEKTAGFWRNRKRTDEQIAQDDEAWGDPEEVYSWWSGKRAPAGTPSGGDPLESSTKIGPRPDDFQAGDNRADWLPKSRPNYGISPMWPAAPGMPYGQFKSTADARNPDAVNPYQHLFDQPPVTEDGVGEDHRPTERYINARREFAQHKRPEKTD
jgi:hypothetical protein